MQGDRTRAQALFDLGERAERSGDPGGALGWYDAATRADPGHSAAWQRRCGLLRRLDRAEEAHAAAQAFAAALPGAAAAHAEAGMCLMVLHRTDEAVAAFERAVKIDPGLRTAWRSLGVALGKLGRFEEAFRCFDRAEGRAPEAPPPPARRDPELAAAVHDRLAALQEAGGGFTHISADGPFSFKAALAVLGFLLCDYDMDGVVVAVSRPAQMYRQALSRRAVTAHPPHYIEVAASPPKATDDGTAGGAGGDRAGPTAGDVTVLSAFEPDRIAASVRAALQKVAARYGGEEHFVLIDDLAAMEFYNGADVVRRFCSGFFGELSGLGIYTFAVLPDGKAQLLGTALSVPPARLRVEGRWLAGA
ncbi:MAG: tetratricopeptide repeat protein [Euryarchaeota archaeon]|nr:tetratricopeptide repeat protein [Euryarchaeota archaeon]